MRQELDMLDQEMKHLMEVFATSCRIKGSTSYDGILKVVNDHIEMKDRCKLVQHDLQVLLDQSFDCYFLPKLLCQ